MAKLTYVGRNPDSDAVVVPKSAADAAQAAAAVTTDSVATQIAGVAATLTTRSYVDAQDVGRAHITDVDAADALYVPASYLNAANGVAGLDSSGNLLSAQLPAGVKTDRVAQSFSVATSSIAPTFDAASGAHNVGGSPSWTHTGTSGAYALLAFYADRPGPATTPITFGGQNMTQLLSIPNTSGPFGNTYLQIYGISGTAGGAQAVSMGAPGFVWWNACSVTYLNVVSVSTPTTALSTSARNNFSHSVTLTALNQVGLVFFGLQENTGVTTLSGGTQRWKDDNGGAGINVSDTITIGTTTVNATQTQTVSWSAAALILTGPAIDTGLGSVTITVPTTVTSTVQPGTQLATIPIPDLGFPYRMLPFAWVRGDSSGATQPASPTLGTGNYGLITAVVPGSAQVYGLGICTGSWYTDAYPMLPYAALNQTPLTVPATTGAKTLNLYGSMWSGTTYTFYPDELTFFVTCIPAL